MCLLRIIHQCFVAQQNVSTYDRSFLEMRFKISSNTTTASQHLHVNEMKAFLKMKWPSFRTLES